MRREGSSADGVKATQTFVCAFSLRRDLVYTQVLIGVSFVKQNINQIKNKSNDPGRAPKLESKNTEIVILFLFVFKVN